MPAFRVYRTELKRNNDDDPAVHVALSTPKVEEYFINNYYKTTTDTDQKRKRDFMAGWRKKEINKAYKDWSSGARDGNFVYEHGGYGIELYADEIKDVINNEIVDVFEPVYMEKKTVPTEIKNKKSIYKRKLTPEQYFDKLEDIPPIPTPEAILARRNLKKDFEDDSLYIDFGNGYNLIDNYIMMTSMIIERIKHYMLGGYANENSKFRIEFYGGDKLVTGTPYAPFVYMAEFIKMMVDKYKDRYQAGEELVIYEAVIRHKINDDVKRQKIYGCNITRQKNKFEIINDMTRRMLINNITMYIDDLKKATYICSPITTKHCMLKCILYGVYNTMDIKRSETAFFKKALKLNIELTQTISDIRNINILLGDKYYIECLFINNGIIEKITDGKNDDKQISLLIKGGHCYYISYDSNFLVDKPEEHDLTHTVPILKKEYKNMDEVIYTYDMETTDDADGKTLCYAVGVFDGKKSSVWYGSTTKPAIELFITEFIDKINKRVIIYAHNGGKFDTKILINYLLTVNKRDMINNYLESGGRIIELELKNAKGRLIKIRDSFNFITSSLDSACKDFKTETKKLTDTVEHDKININNCFTDSKKAIDGKTIKQYTEQYLRNDVQCLYEVLLNFNKVINDAYGFNFYTCLTNAGISKKVFLTKYYEDNLYYLNDTIDSEIREYYYGGRNEVFNMIGEYKENKTLYYVDVTSLYPYMMHSNKYGTGKMTVTELQPGTTFNDTWRGLVKCIVRTINKDMVPFHALKYNNKLMFVHMDTPTELILTTDDIKYSLDNNLGYEYQFIKLYNYDTEGYIYKELISDLFKMKDEAEKNGNDALRSTAKTVANSSYGYWGIRYNDRDMNIINEHKNDDDRNNYLNGILNDQKLKTHERINKYDLYQITDRMEPNVANIYLAFKICADARRHLYKMMMGVTKKGGKLYYCDTDSMICNYNIYEDVEYVREFVGTDTGRLGELTNEIKIAVVKNSNNKPSMIEYIKHNCTGINAIGFTDYVVTGNKQYYIGYDNIINGEHIKFEILKCKGINSKTKYNERLEDAENKTIIYKGISKDGKYKLNKTDFIMMGDGWKVGSDAMNFRGSFKNNIMRGEGLIKTTTQKEVRQIYNKGLLDGEKINTITI